MKAQLQRIGFVALAMAGMAYGTAALADDAINQKVIAAMLQGLGCCVDMVHNGQEALEHWERNRTYDLILMDCQMPVMSGFEATSAIRAREGDMDSRIPIIAMTAQAYAQDRERCRRAGMDDHLAKPLTRADLEGMLASWLRPGSTAPEERTPEPARAMALDTALLERLTAELGEGGEELLVELIEGFCVDFAQTLERLMDHATGGRMDKLSFEAHRVRSSTANLGAVELNRLCERLEQCGQRKETSLAEPLVLQLREAFPPARDALMAYVERLPRRAPDATLEATGTPRAAATTSVPS